MILNLDYVFEKYQPNVSGIIHIGGHYGNELSKYKEHGVDNVILFEPLSSNFEVLQNTIKTIGGNIIAHQVALGNDNRKVTMNISSNEAQSSSILTPKVHLTAHPEVSFVGIEEVEMKKLDDYDCKKYNMAIIDVQGYELEVLKGSTKTLETVDYIYCEVNRDEVYEGNARVEEIDEFLSTYGFKRVETQWYYTEVWGDAFYVKEKKINSNVSIICACKNRLESLKVSLSSWILFDKIKEIIIVDWDSKTPIHDLTKLDSRIKVIRVNNKKYFNLAQPLNLAASHATGDYILKLDTDYIINPYYNFFESYPIDETCFVSGAHNSPELVYGPDKNGEYAIDMANNEFMNVVDYVNCFSQYFRYLRGMLYVSKENFLKVSGYNETIDTYGFEDGDLETKLKSLGLDHKKISYDYTLMHIPHSDKKRIENCKYDIGDEREVRYNLSQFYEGDLLDAQTYYGVVSRLVEKNRDGSKRKGHKITWKVDKINEQYYIAEDTIKAKFYGLSSVNYVSLEESVDRQTIFVNQFYEYGIENIKSIISKRFFECNDVVTGKNIYQLNDGTKGCCVSHLKAIKQWYDTTDEQYGFFCEDDLSLDTVPYWNFTWKEFIDNIPKDVECVQLLTIRGNFDTFEFRERYWDDWGATAYVMCREYARKIIDTYIKDGTYHLEIPNQEIMPLVENILFTSIGKVYTVPLFVENTEFTSTFENNDNDVNSGQKTNHKVASDIVLNYWKNINQTDKKMLKSFIVKSKFKPKTSKIVDYFIYFNEKELLELRINLLKDYVDKFVIVDANRSHTGQEKSFTCKNTLKELGLWDEDKIQVIEFNLNFDNDVIQFTDIDRFFNKDNSELLINGFRERMQRDALLSVIDQFDDDTVFIISDCDEIINPEHLGYVPNIVRNNPNIIFKIPLVYLEGRADLRLFYEKNNNYVGWDCSMFLATKKVLKINTPNEIRCNYRISYPIAYVGQYENGHYIRYEDLGWHFSWMGDINRKKIKSLSYTHYGHEFDHIIYKKCSGELMQQFLENHEAKEGNIGVSGMVGTVLKAYALENLPQIIFDLPRVKQFLLPSSVVKNELEELLLKYSLDTENAEHNFNLGVWYENQGHTAPALSYYLRCAERAEDEDLAYEALIRGSYCYEKQGTRDGSSRSMLWQAQSFLPHRPEAYFLLSRFAEKRDWWQDCYMNADLALRYCRFDCKPLRTDVEYPGKYGLLFEKAVSGYWWEKVEESKKIFEDLRDNYDLSEFHKNLVNNNLDKINQKFTET